MNIPCRKSKLQEYGCQVCVRPRWKSDKEWICFDACLARELMTLWDLGIITTGCCCGQHEGGNGKNGYISVENEYIPLMKRLGYVVHINPLHPYDEDSFVPKTFDKKEKRG